MEEESSFVGSGETRDELYKSIKSYSKVLNSLFGHSEESKPKLMLCRKRLIIECVKLLFTDPDFFLEKNIFQLLWKEGFHIFIERYRKLITAEDDSVCASPRKGDPHRIVRNMIDSSRVQFLHCKISTRRSSKNNVLTMPIAQKSPNCSFPSSPSSDAYLPSSFISGTWNDIVR